MLNKIKTILKKNLFYILMISMLIFSIYDFIYNTVRINKRITLQKSECSNILEIIKIKYYHVNPKNSDLIVYIQKRNLKQ